ncbi:hypothetical protein H9657_12820 [Cellulomonas sp. Sa3CUA2]|uniref:DUF4304 domain-containing protein n=1 Tax=Cellulomonas avistercoris TaxID=2762242 RepID=A0ABR8QFG1_9CELL|nr:DUF6301 family protein [Cellulomonas avistercoris]MBD7919154.1 hypothetical protein [Cellulomonas avistercoris]
MRTASPDQISDLLRAFGAVTWPTGRQTALDLAAARGWSVELETKNSVSFITNLGTNDDSARALVLSDEATDGLLDKLTVNVSDAEVAAPAELRKAYTDLCRVAENALGAPAYVERGSNPRTFWDLDNGGRVGFQRLDDIVIMILISRDAADLLREDKRLGLDPNRITGAGDEDL